MSILLMGIGILMGAISVGSTLIHAAKIRNIASQKRQFETAVMAFQQKYDCIPGDCANVSALGFGTSSGYGYAGNANGYVDNQFEHVDFWYHLSKAGLIDWQPAIPGGGSHPSGGACVSKGSTSPCLNELARNPNDVQGGWWILSGVDSNMTFPEHIVQRPMHYWWLTADVMSMPDASAVIFLPSDAQAIDQKIDDGWPLDGVARVIGSRIPDPYGPRTVPPASAGENLSCADTDTTPTSYNLRVTTRENTSMCSLMIDAPF